MSAAHHEIHFEKFIVDHLTGNGWIEGDPSKHDRKLALYPEDVIGWIQESQPETWEKLSRIHKGDAEKVVLERLAATLDAKTGGTVKVLRRGFGVAGGGTVQMSQSMPEDARNETVQKRYAANRVRIVRQVRYSLDNENAIDLVAFINGIPVATFELKTDFTQSVEAAKHQYRSDRNPKSTYTGRMEPLLTFKRGAVVHFAMSDSEVYMTTKLAGDSTYFLPFNKGNDGAAGNPAADPYPVKYMWEDLMQRDNWLRIFHRFVFTEKKEEETAQGTLQYKETQIFPRYHQWEAVTQMIDTVRKEGPGHQYLNQHSAGSGKTNTISWTSHELIRLRHDDGTPYFNSVIVVTDRTVLDAQLQEAISQIEHQTGVVKAVDRETSSLPKSQQLAQALLDGTPIIVVTLQTFPYAMEAILTEQSLRDRKFAVIIDEAHNSQTGSVASKLRQVLALDSSEDLAAMTPDEILEKLQSVRGLPDNVSHFAFTATPKHSTLMLFGRPQNPAEDVSSDNPPVAFHTYTMQQAIEEGFILDVLQNYTSYKMAFKLGSEYADKKRVDTKYAGRALAKWLTLHPTNVTQKVHLIIEHFHSNVVHLLGGQAKAMVVTNSRAAAVKYKLAFDRYVEKQGYRGIQSMVAFSGKILGKQINDDIDFRYPEDEVFTEDNMNPGAKGRDLRKAFDTPEYQVMLVANKFQTGFDQPKLVAMYLDKKISGVEAVQTLSRLNRTHKGKDTTYVIDFANDPEEILAAFKLYYKAAQISDIQNPHIVYDMKMRLDDMQVYEAEEVRQFGLAITAPNPSHAKLYSVTQPATDRFNGRMKMLNDAIDVCEREYQIAERSGDKDKMAKADARRSEHTKARDELLIFSEGLAKFVRAYEYCAQLIEFGDAEMEAFAAFAKLLKKRLKGATPEEVDITGLALTHFKLLHKGELGSGLGDGDPDKLKPTSGTGGRDPKDRERAYLAELIQRLNEAFGKDVTDKDKVAFAVHISEKLRGNEKVMDQVRNNPVDQAMKADLPSAATKAIVEAMGSHQSMAKRLLGDEVTRNLFLTVVYEMLSKDVAAGMIEQARGDNDA
ncbi:type I restriction endonuclease [Mariprofundus sp. KV]|uniref:type I restriction endonuclease subunit R n=1 Tax=Mariprofundus sp. KV TaxID=2608715 RepID=UPI0015A2194D|nr:type I restriction endonuclease [Mariprofundus sp. KV]NWF36067.1 type I restriction endonuclease subunit R [Mariprofundus sp. KV]